MIQNLIYNFKLFNKLATKNDQPQTFLKYYSLNLGQFPSWIVRLKVFLDLLFLPGLFALFGLLIVIYQTEILYGFVDCNDEKTVDNALITASCVLFILLSWMYSSWRPEGIKRVMTSPTFFALLYLLSIMALVVTTEIICYTSYFGIPVFHAFNTVLLSWRVILGLLAGFVLGLKINSSYDWYYNGFSSLKHMPASLYVEWIFWFSLPLLFGSFDALYAIYSAPLELMHSQNVNINEEINVSKPLVKFNTSKMLFCADKLYCTGECKNKITYQPIKVSTVANKLPTIEDLNASSIVNKWSAASVNMQHLAISKENADKIADNCWSVPKHKEKLCWLPPGKQEWHVNTRFLPNPNPGEFAHFSTRGIASTLTCNAASATFEKLSEQNPMYVPTVMLDLSKKVMAPIVARGESFVLLGDIPITKVWQPVRAAIGVTLFIAVGEEVFRKADGVSSSTISWNETERLKESVGTANVKFEGRHNEKFNAIRTIAVIKK